MDYTAPRRRPEELDAATVFAKLNEPRPKDE
jgi:hypothetical protein